MTEPPPRPGPLAGIAFVVAAVAAAAWSLALLQPWGDVGVVGGALDRSRPTGLVTALGLGALAGLALTLLGPRRRRRWAVGAALGLAGFGGVLVALTTVTTAAQVLPLDGSWWGLLTAVAVTLTGVISAAAGFVRPAGRARRLVAVAVAAVVPVALVVTGAVVAPGWATHRVESVHPAVFDEGAAPITVDGVGWQQPTGDDLVTVIGGRVLTARDTTGPGGCVLRVQALDARDRSRVWSVTRPLRCDGPRLAVLDGNGSTVRVTLRAEVGGVPLTGPPLMLYLGLEDGRSFSPSGALDRVQAWSEGFGLVLTADTLDGLDPRTGVTVWSRPLPDCGGTPATVGIPAAVPAGQRAVRAPTDGGTPNGTVPLGSVASDVVVGTTCDASGTVTRSAWLIDVLNGPASDRTVALPTAPTGDPAGSSGAAADVPTTFLTWIDTVVAAVPVVGAEADLTALVGLDRASGTVLWTRPAAVVRTVDVSPTGFLSVSGPPPAGVEPQPAGVTDVVGARTGQLLASRDDPSPVLASVALVGGRLEVAQDQTFVVRDPVSGRVGATLPTDGCRPGVDTGLTSALLAPGSVILRCAAGDDRLIGLVDRP